MLSWISSASFEEQMTLDVTGHYARDDVFSFEVNRRRLE